MRRVLSGLAVGGCLFSPIAVYGEPSTPATTPSFADGLVSAFDTVCLQNRGSWDGMKRAGESSPLGFKKVGDAKGHYQANYMAFPVMISLKRWGQGYACIAQSIVEDSSSERLLADRLVAEGFGLDGVEFKNQKQGLKGEIPGTKRTTGAGTFHTSVHVKLSAGPIPATHVAQLAVTN